MIKSISILDWNFRCWNCMFFLFKFVDDDCNNEKNENCDDGDCNYLVCGYFWEDVKLV